MLSRQTAFFICCQRWDSNSLLSEHKPTMLVTQKVILIGSVASEKTSYCSYARGPHSVFDIGDCTIMHCVAGCMSLVGQGEAEKN